MTQSQLQKRFFFGLCFFSIIYTSNVFADKGESKDLSGYQAKIIEAVKDTTKNNPPKAQSNRDTRTFLKDKGNFKAQAFCIEWEDFIPKTLSGDKNLEIKSIGNAWNWSSKTGATGAAVRFCKKRLQGNNWSKKSEIKTSCKCEVLHVNDEFFLSQNANTVLLNYLSTLANEANNSEKKPNQIAKTAEPPVKTTQKANNIATTVESLTNQKPLALSQAEPPAPQATQAKFITKSVAKEFYADVVAFIKTKPNVDIVKFAELYNSRPSIESDWGDLESTKFNQIKLEMLKEATFKDFFNTQIEKRNLEKSKARAGLEQSLNKKLASLDTILAENFGSPYGNKALSLIKKGTALKSQLSAKTNDEIQVFVGEAEALLAATKRRQDFKSKITSINEKLETVVAENFGTDKGNQALAFIKENKAALANIAPTSNEKFNELMQKSQALISAGANVNDQSIDVSPPKTISNQTDEPSSIAPKGWKDIVVFPEVDGNPSVPLKSEKGEEIFRMFNRSGAIEKIARGCADDLKAGRKLNECFRKSQLDEYVHKAHKSYLRKKEEEKAAAKRRAERLKEQERNQKAEKAKREKEKAKKEAQQKLLDNIKKAFSEYSAREKTEIEAVLNYTTTAQLDGTEDRYWVEGPKCTLQENGRMIINGAYQKRNTVIKIKEFNQTAFKLEIKNEKLDPSARRTIEFLYWGDDKWNFRHAFMPKPLSTGAPDLSRLQKAWTLAFDLCPGKKSAF